MYKHYLEIFGYIIFIFCLVHPILGKVFFYQSDKNYKKEEKKYFNFYNFFRGVATVAVIFNHTHYYRKYYYQNDFSDVILQTLNNTLKFSVAGFIIISAFFIAKKATFWQFWKNKLHRVYIPYIIIATIGYFYKYGVNNFEFYEYLYEIIFGKVFGPYYFMVLIFQIYFLYDIGFFLIKQSRYLSYAFFYICIFITAYTNFSDISWLPKLFVLPEWYQHISILNYAIYIGFGFHISHFMRNPSFLKEFYTPKVIKSYRILAILFIFLMTIRIFIIREKVINTLSFLPIIFFIWICGEGYIIETQKNIGKLRNIFFEMFCWIGKNSMGTYLIHPFILYIIWKIQIANFGGPTIGFISVFVINIFLSLGVWVVYKKLLNLIGIKA